MTDYYVIEREDGSQDIVTERPRRSRDGAFRRWAHADRAPCADGTEDWNFPAHQWEVNADRALAWTNVQHENRHGPDAASLARAMKLVEARRLLGLPSTVELEAEALGIPVLNLAQQIVDQAAAGVAAEQDRIEARRRIREA